MTALPRPDMAYLDESDDVFVRYLPPPDVPRLSAEAKRRLSEARMEAANRDAARILGRSPRFPAGWWIGPGLLVGLLIWGGLALFIVRGIEGAAYDAHAVEEWQP